MMNDPFDVANADSTSPGFLGQSPDFWRNIANLGANLSTAANARTAGGFLANGTGFAGPLGAATMATQQQAGQQAALRSQLGLQGQQTRSLGLQNALAGFGLPAAQAQGMLRYRYLTDPTFRQQFDQEMSGGGPAQPAGPLAQPAAQPTSASNGAIPPEQRDSMIADAVKGTPIPADLAGALVGYESGWNPGAVNKDSGAFGLGGILPSTAKNPGFGVQPLPAGATPPQQLKFATDYLYARGKAAGIQDSDWSNPAKVTAALAAYHGPQADADGVNGQDYAANVQGRIRLASNGPVPPSGPAVAGQSGPAGAPQPPGPMPGVQPPGPILGAPQPPQAQMPGAPQSVQPLPQAMAQANMYEHQANLIELRRNMGLPVMGDPAALRQAAQQWRQYALAGATAFQTKAGELPLVGPAAAAQAANSNIEARPGALVHIQTPTGPIWVKNPQLEKVTNADGSETYTHITPPLPNAPPGTPGESTPVIDVTGNPVVAKIAPQMQDARNKAFSDFAGKDTDSYLSAQNTQAWLEQMNHAAETLNAAGGFLGTGPTSPARLAFASSVNDILRTAGLPNAFDATKIASWEELKKATTTAGFELASHYEGHSKQAATTILNATAAVPGEENSPVGFHRVSSGIREMAQQEVDRHNFTQDVYSANDPRMPPAQGPMAEVANGLHGDLTQAEVAFYKNNPAQMYARRAISSVTPYDIKTDKELSRYLPGTFLRYNGRVVQVPERPGAPPIPEYLKNTQPAAQQ